MSTSIFGALHDLTSSNSVLQHDIYPGVMAASDEVDQSLHLPTQYAIQHPLSDEYVQASQIDLRTSTTPLNLENAAEILTGANLNVVNTDLSMVYLRPDSFDEFNHQVDHIDPWDGPELEDNDDDPSHDVEDHAFEELNAVFADQEGQEFPSGDGDPPSAHYEFRSAPREKDIQFSGAYIDQDNSGNYDPNHKTKPVTKPRRVAVECSDNYDHETISERRPKPTIGWAKARKEGISFEVTLKLNSVKGKELMTFLRSSKPDNWPGEPWNFLIDNALEAEAAELDSQSQYLLRSEIAKKRHDAGNNEKHQDHEKYQGFDYTGHPEGRGCKACLALHQPCSMLEPKGEYPCLTCEADNCECELLLEPKIKRGCSTCEKGTCSYLDGGDHSKPCFQCQQAGYICIAGPAISLTCVRLTEDGSPAFTVEELKKSFQRASRRSKKRKAVVETVDPASIDLLKKYNNNGFSNPNTAASLAGLQRTKKSRLDQIIGGTRRPNLYGPQTPQMMGIPAVQPRLYAPGRPQSSLGPTSRTNRFFSGGRPVFTKPARIPISESAMEAQRLSVSEARLIEPIAQKAPSLGVKTIQTKLAHPITFNAPNTASKPCHFHTQSCMPLIGYGSTSAQVHAWPSGAGYTEIPMGGGHTAQGCEPTRICIACTSTRLAICLCTTHKIRAMPTNQNDDENVSDFLDKILIASSEEEIKDVHGRCCSVCPRLAHWTCTAETPEEGTSVGAKGCGLRLCDFCNVVLTEVYQGNLDEMLLSMDDSDESLYPLGLRADAEFLKTDGLMIKQLSIA